MRNNADEHLRCQYLGCDKEAREWRAMRTHDYVLLVMPYCDGHLNEAGERAEVVSSNWPETKS
jgi:hypothetical protein